MRTLNYPFTHQEVKDLPMGFTASATYLGMGTDENGKSFQRFAPTRKQRRAGLQKQNRNPWFGKMVHHYQVIVDKETGNVKLIGHWLKK